MSYLRMTHFIFVIAFLVIPSVFAQPQKNSDKGNIKKIAISTLETSLEESRQIKDFEDRTEVTKEIVEILFKERPNRCLQAVELLFNDFIRLDAKDFSNDELFIEFQDKTAGKIIKLASIFDKKLAEKYLNKYISNLSDSLPKDEGNVKNPRLSRVYLKIALEILESNRSLAISVAERSLRHEVSLETLTFLASLHTKDTALADNFCLKAIQAVNQRSLKDINESFVLYAYIFSLSDVPAIDSDSAVYFPLSLPEIASKEVSSNLVSFFLQSSVGFLTNSQTRVPTDRFQVVQGAIGDYFFLKTIEPQVIQHVPILFSQLKNQQVSLLNLFEQQNLTAFQTPTEESDRQNLSYKKGLTKEELLKKAESERDPKKRDGFLYKAAIIATQEENYEEALKIADEMSEYADETTKPYIKYNVCRKLIGINEVDRALVISQKDKDASRKASIFVFGARKLLQDKTNIYQVSLFLAEAQKLAEKMSGGKALMLIAISTVYSEFDMSSALETLGEAIKATNSQKGFNGKEKLQRSFDEGNGFYIFYELLDSKMNFKSLMPKMSAKSFLNTLQSIQSIENTGFRLRANAMLCKNQILVWR